MIAVSVLLVSAFCVCMLVSGNDSGECVARECFFCVGMLVSVLVGCLVWCCEVLCCEVLCCEVLYCEVLCCEVLCCEVLCCEVL